MIEKKSKLSFVWFLLDFKKKIVNIVKTKYCNNKVRRKRANLMTKFLLVLMN